MKLLKEEIIDLTVYKKLEDAVLADPVVKKFRGDYLRDNNVRMTKGANGSLTIATIRYCLDKGITDTKDVINAVANAYGIALIFSKFAGKFSKQEILPGWILLEDRKVGGYIGLNTQGSNASYFNNYITFTFTNKKVTVDFTLFILSDILSKRSIMDIKDVKLKGETITRDLTNYTHSIVHDIMLPVSGLKDVIINILKDAENI